MSHICYYISVESDDGTPRAELRWRTDAECEDIPRDALLTEMVSTTKKIRGFESAVATGDLEDEFEDYYTNRIAEYRQRRSRLVVLLQRQVTQSQTGGQSQPQYQYARCSKCEGNAYTCACSFHTSPPPPPPLPRDGEMSYTECARCHRNRYTCGCASPPVSATGVWRGNIHSPRPPLAVWLPLPEIDLTALKILQPDRGDEKMKFEHAGNEYHIEFERKLHTRQQWDTLTNTYIDVPYTHPHTHIRILKVVPEQGVREWPVILTDSVGCARGDQFSPAQGRLRALRKIGVTMEKEMRAGMWRAYESRRAPRPTQGEVVPK